MTLLRSHLIAMVILAAVVSVMLAFIKYDNPGRIKRYALKLFIYLVGGVIVAGWVIHFT